jgi:hypothetical protein
MGVCATPASRSTSLPTKGKGAKASNPRWSDEKDVTRMLAVIIALKPEFLHRSDTLTRQQLDAKDYKPFWVRAAELFNDPNFMPSLIPDPEGRDLQMSAEPSGHQTDANTLET